MKFSIVTPSFRNSAWLKLCVASVADQSGAQFEHIVQDAGSDDGTLEWLAGDARVQAIVEKDKGMYDAVNRGWRRAGGDVLSYINCDEQYLPGALKMVGDFFEHRPEVDVIFGDCIVVNQDGSYVCERRALTPERLHCVLSGNLSFLTAAMFLRRRVLDEHRLFFNESYTVMGDVEWAVRLIKSRLRMEVLPRFVSVFTETGHNLSLSPVAAAEKAVFRATAPAWARCCAPLIVAYFRLRRLLAGHYAPRRQEYAIYTMNSPRRRLSFTVSNPTFRWNGPPPA